MMRVGSISKNRMYFLQLFMYFSYRININNNHKYIKFICICFVYIFVYHVGIKLGHQLSFISIYGLIPGKHLVKLTKIWSLIKSFFILEIVVESFIENMCQHQIE